jgi:hypothetical protein
MPSRDYDHNPLFSPPDGQMFITRPDVPLLLTITIDNKDAANFPYTPFTLNATAGLGDQEEELYFDGESCIIEGDVPTQLRTLARMIDEGRVTR